MYYKVGDKVLIKENANEIANPEDVPYVDEMNQYLGTVRTVTNIRMSSSDVPRYNLEGCEDPNDGYQWVFVAEWLEPYIEEDYNDIDTAKLNELFKE